MKEETRIVSLNWTDCTADAVSGDVIRFSEGAFGGFYRKPKYLGDRLVVAKVLNDRPPYRKRFEQTRYRYLSFREVICNATHSKIIYEWP